MGPAAGVIANFTGVTYKEKRSGDGLIRIMVCIMEGNRCLRIELVPAMSG
jgi:hypothetical protein